MMDKRVIVTGGAGFIGSALIRRALLNTSWDILNIDKLTYASDPCSIPQDEYAERYSLMKADICDTTSIAKIFHDYAPDAVIHLAATTQV